MEVVDDIAAMPTGPAGPFGSDVPQAMVLIKQMVRLPKAQPTGATTKSKKEKAK
jgi:hypothetical protein